MPGRYDEPWHWTREDRDEMADERFHEVRDEPVKFDPAAEVERDQLAQEAERIDFYGRGLQLGGMDEMADEGWA